MSNLYQFLEKTKKKNIFLEDKNILKEKLFLLNSEELDLFKRDRKTFENFYGENVTNVLSSSVKNKTNDQFFNLFEVRSGKLKYLIAKTEDQIEKAKKEKNKVILESELKKLKKRERRLFLLTNEKIKNYYSFNEADESQENKKESFLKKFENLTGSILKTATSKINYKKNSKLTIAIKWGARIISMLYAYNAISALAATMGAIAPILGTTVIVAVCSFILFLIALKTPTALNFLRLVLNKNKEIISKTLGVSVEEITGFSDNVKGLATKFDKIIKEYKIKAKKVLVDGVLKKINLAFKDKPEVLLGIISAFFALKLFGLFKNPVTFLIQFFSGMLFKSCTSIADGFIAVYDKFKGEKEGLDLVKSVWSTFHGFEVPQKILDTFFKDEVKSKDQDEKPKDQETEIKTPENASFSYQFEKQLQSYYYEHIQNNIMSKSAFVKEKHIFYEAEQDNSIKTNIVNKVLLGEISPDLYRKKQVEVTIFSLRKGNFKANINMLDNKIYLLENKVLKKTKEEIEAMLKKMGLQNQELTKLNIVSNHIVITKDSYITLKNLFINYSEQNVTPTEQAQDTEEQQENKGNTEEQEGNKTEEQNVDNASKLLNDNNTLYVPITQNSEPENLIMVKDKPNDENILGYIEMKKKGVEKNNYRFDGSIYVKKVFDYPSNKLVSTLFEEDQPEMKNFVNITKQPALISVRVDKGKYVINSGKFLGMFGEKSKKGKLNETFFDYVRFGVKKLKNDYMNKYDLEIKKLDQKQKNELDQKINDILFDFNKTDNFAIKSDLLRERKKQELEKIAFSQFEKEKTPETEEEPVKKIDKNKILREKEIYINIPDEKTKIDISDLQLSTEKPIDGIGYVKLTKKDNDNFDASFFVKRAFNYQKNNFLKTIFEQQEQEENLPESEIEKIDYIDVTGEPAEVEIELIDDKFAVSQKGGFLGFNKKISKIGKVNNNYKEYINNIIPQIEREVSKNKIDKNDPDIQDKIKDISTIDLKGDIKKTKDEKVNEILSKTETDSMENAEKEAKEKNIPFISSRNAIALGLFSFVSALAIYWHGTGKSVTPESAMLIDVLEGIIKASEAAEKVDFNQVINNFDPQTQIEGVADAVAPDTGNLPISDNPNDLKEVLDSPALKNAEDALSGVSQENIDNADAGSGNAGGDSNDSSNSGDSDGSGNKTVLDSNQKEEFIKSYDKDFKTIVNKNEVFEKIKASWVASHPDSGIKIEDIKHGSELYMKLDNFTDKVIGSVESIKGEPDGFYTKTPSLVAAINKDPSNAINAIKDKLDVSIEKGWTANQIVSINGDVTVPEVDKPIPQEVIQDTPEPIKPILIVDPPKEPVSITDPIPKVDDTAEPSKPSITKTPDAGDETVKPTNTTSDVKPEDPKPATTEEPKPTENTDQKTNPGQIVSDKENLLNASVAFKELNPDDLKTVTNDLKSIANAGNVNNLNKDSIENLVKLLGVDENFIKNLNMDRAQSILNAIPKPLNQSYEYKSDDEKFLLNEYFKMEERLNRWKK